jgi:multiple sugar transport system permease protein
MEKKRPWQRVLRDGTRLLVALLFLLPLLWLIGASLRPQGTPLTGLAPLAELTLRNYGRIWTLIPLARFTLNSASVVGLAVPLTLLTSSWAGFAIAHLPHRARRRLVLFSLAILMVPGAALWFTRFLLYRELGWLDSSWALIAPAWMGSSPFYVLMFYRAFRRQPPALFDAARLDGAGVLGSWWRIALPLARPTAVAVALLSFILYWGDFISPLLYLSEEKDYTLPVALQLLQQMDRSDWPLLMAAAVATTAVPLLLFLLLQPYFAGVGRDG